MCQFERAAITYPACTQIYVQIYLLARYILYSAHLVNYSFVPFHFRASQVIGLWDDSDNLNTHIVRLYADICIITIIIYSWLNTHLYFASFYSPLFISISANCFNSSATTKTISFICDGIKISIFIQGEKRAQREGGTQMALSRGGGRGLWTYTMLRCQEFVVYLLVELIKIHFTSLWLLICAIDSQEGEVGSGRWGSSLESQTMASYI